MSSTQFNGVPQSVLFFSLPFATTYLANCSLKITNTEAAWSSMVVTTAAIGVLTQAASYVKPLLPLPGWLGSALRMSIDTGILYAGFSAGKAAGKRYDQKFTLGKAFCIQALALPVGLVAAAALGKCNFSH